MDLPPLAVRPMRSNKNKKNHHSAPVFAQGQLVSAAQFRAREGIYYMTIFAGLISMPTLITTAGWAAVKAVQVFNVTRHLLLSIVLVLLMATNVATIKANEQLQISGEAGSGAVNLRNADIGLFIESIAELTGKNFIIDPRVKGKVTVISNADLDQNEMYELFLSVLNVHGYVTLPIGNAIKIVPNVNSRFGGDGSTAKDSENLEALVAQVITITQASAIELVPVLRPMLPAEAHLVAITNSNKLLVISSAHHADRLAKVVNLLDNPISVENKVMTLQNAQAVDVANILAKLQQTESGALLRLATIVPDERTNSLVILQARAIAPAIEQIIHSLDKPNATISRTQTIKVIYLEYADATKLAPIIERVASGNIVMPKVAKGEGQAATQNAVQEPLITTVQAEPELNALVISTPPETLPLLEKLVSDLDVRRAQVLVEAVIAELSSSQAEELGIQWALKGLNTLGATSFSDKGNNLINLGTSTAIPGSGLTLGVASLSSSGNGIAGLIRAISSNSNSNIVATPSLVTLDNKEAEIVVGSNVPFVTGQYTNAGSGSDSSTTNPFQTIKRENVGVKLKIKPKINQGDAITLSISQEVSSVANQSTVTSDIVTNTRTIQTSVIANDKDLIILGGLIDDQLVDNHEKVPFLGDLPVIGGAFRYTKSTIQKRNLMVFIRPTIIRDAAMLESLSHEKYQFLRAQQVLLNETQKEVFEGIDKPLLEAIKDIGRAIPVVPKPVDTNPEPAPHQSAADDKADW